MASITKTAITSAEIGILWMTYQTKSLMSKMLESFAGRTKDKAAKNILTAHMKENEKLISEIKEIFNAEKAVIPIAFGDQDVFNDAPVLFDDMFHIMFLRLMMQINLGSDAVHLSMTFRKDVQEFFEHSLKDTQETYKACNDFLTDQGVLVRPPYVTMPKSVEFIEDTKYMSGIKLFGDKRSLNTLEIAYIFHTLEINIVGMQLMTGFAQVAKESEVKAFFIEGKELAKKIIGELSKILLDSDIQPPGTWAGKATDSVVPPFSDKLMMNCTNVMASVAVGSDGLGMAFSMRSDLPAKLAFISVNTLKFAREGGKLMIRHKWLEEPPQMEDRNMLSKSKM